MRPSRMLPTTSVLLPVIALLVCAGHELSIETHAAGAAWDDDLRRDAGDFTGEPFALVELFTSEGCSSCPPADALLGELGERAREDGSNVLTLAYHVDYWNHLGWKDRFSEPRFSERQLLYARGLGRSRYTPQMIVNGVASFVGSDRKRAALEIADALQLPATTNVRLL